MSRPLSYAKAEPSLTQLVLAWISYRFATARQGRRRAIDVAAETAASGNPTGF